MRGFRLRCPDCGVGRIFQSLVRVRHHCLNCGLIFQREQGYFIGALYVNVIATESLLFVGLVVALFARPSSLATVFKVMLALAILLPLLFFRHSRSLWLCFDHFLDPADERVRLHDLD
jgi:uncharacterized protein (DUF983 family)